VLVILVPLERKKPKGAFGWGGRTEGGGAEMCPHRKTEKCQNFQLVDEEGVCKIKSGQDNLGHKNFGLLYAAENFPGPQAHNFVNSVTSQPQKRETPPPPFPSCTLYTVDSVNNNT